MADVKLTDPLGRTFTLADSGWYMHVIARHPEMRQHRELVEQAVISPLSIWISHKEPDCRVYYGNGPRSSVLVAVIACLDSGVVKTAYLTRAEKGAQREWP